MYSNYLQVNGQLTDQHLLQLSKRITDETTRTELGLNLGLPGHEIQMTRADNKSELTIATYDMLRIWFRATSSREAAWTQLEGVLRKTRLKACISEVLYANI